MNIQEMAGVDLGTRVSAYSAFDAILYALAVGAGASDLPLVYERDLHVLPTYSLALANWVTEAAGEVGVYDRNRTLHGAQSLTMKAPLPRSGKVETTGSIVAVYDKGSAALVQINAESEYFDAVYTIFVPGFGGWGGDRGPVAAQQPGLDGDVWRQSCTMSDEQAVLYRLTGDVHPVHIDPVVSAANGLPAPIVHGLCTLGFAARQVGPAVGAQPWELRSIDARFRKPVLPGAQLHTEVFGTAGRDLHFTVGCAEQNVIDSGRASF